jgi:hypothetical protein
LKFRSPARCTRSTRARAIAALSCIAIISVLVFGAQESTRAAATPSPNSDQLFGVHPVEEGSTTLPGGHFNFALVPGQSITDGIVVANFSNRTLHFEIYGADLITARGGGLAPAQPTATMRGVGAWIRVAIPTLAVPAHEQMTAHFTVTVPAVVSSGQYLGALVAAANVGITPQGNPIQARTALIAVVTVAGAAHPSASLTPLSMSGTPPGGITFGITLANTGNVLLTYAGSVVITDAAGRRLVSVALTPINAYVVPGGQVPLAAAWSDAASLSTQGSARATVTILFDGKPVSILTSSSLVLNDASGGWAPFLIGFLLAFLVVLLVATWLMRRGRRSRTLTTPNGARGIAVHGLR